MVWLVAMTPSSRPSALPSGLLRLERAADDLPAQAGRAVEPAVGLHVLLELAGAAVGGGLAVVLARLGHAVALLELEVGLGRRARLGRGRPGRDGARHRGGDREGGGPHHLRSPRRGTGPSCAAGRIGERALERKSDLAIEPIAPRYARARRASGEEARTRSSAGTSRRPGAGARHRSRAISAGTGGGTVAPRSSPVPRVRG